jgi:hypothetical protein
MTYFDRDPYDIDGRDEARADALTEARLAARDEAEFGGFSEDELAAYWTPERLAELDADLAVGIRPSAADADLPDGVPF